MMASQKQTYPNIKKETLPLFPELPGDLKNDKNMIMVEAATSTTSEIHHNSDRNYDLPLLPLKKHPRQDVGASCSDRRRLDEEIKTEVKKKKMTKSSGKRGVIAGPESAPPMPDGLMEMVVRNFDVSTVAFVIQKCLFQTDLEKVENRLSMTLKQIASDDFLTEEEKRTLARRTPDKRLEGIEVDFIEPDKDLSKTKMKLKKWELQSSSSYVLSHNWHNVAKRNELKAGDIVQIWFFRSREGKPCFALVKLGREPASSSSSAVGKHDHQWGDGEPRGDVSTRLSLTL